MSISQANTNYRTVSTSTERPQVINGNVLNSAVLNSGVVNSNNITRLGLIQATYVGYTCSEFSTIGNDENDIYIVHTPGLSKDPASNRLRLPTDSIVTGCRVVATTPVVSNTPSTTFSLRVNSAGDYNSGGIAMLTNARNSDINSLLGAVNNLSDLTGIAPCTENDRYSIFTCSGTDGAEIQSGACKIYLTVLIPDTVTPPMI